MKSFLFALYIFIVFTHSYSQSFGWTTGLTFALGNKVNRVGLSTKAFYGYQFVQINAQFNVLYVFQSLALKQKTPEIQVGIGAQFGFNQQDTVTNRLMSLTDKNIPYFYSLGYTYVHYWDKQNTSQGGGILNFNIENFTIATQNDLFGFGQGWRDRFRTGAFIFQYNYLDTRLALKAEFWTGDYTGCTKVLDDKNYPARFGYYLNDKGIYTKKTAGLVSLQIEQIIPNLPFSYQQTARLNIGIDSERMRYAIQNKLMHDMPFYTDKMIKQKQLHYPMLDENGRQYLFKNGQTYKPTTFYFNMGLNEMMFY